MAASDYNVSESICEDQGLNLTCTNEARQLYVSGHGQFFPGCIDIENAEEVFGNPVHPSQQNQTNGTQDDGDGHDDHNNTHDGTSGAFTAHGSLVVVALAAALGLCM
jgi:hypothetical protein